MSERSDNAKYQCGYQTNKKMSETDLGTKKTLIVLVIVVGCFAVLWPKVLYPMLIGSTNQIMKPNNLDKGCCDVISDIDVNTIKIMSELCNTIVQDTNKKSIKGQKIIEQCRKEIYNRCGIDISAILQEQAWLGRTFKQIVDEVRSYNGSLCLKYQFGISPWRLGAPHKVTINLSPIYVRQERPSHLRPEMLHPALREKGSAIVQPYQQPPKSGHPRYVEGRPGPVPGVRPPLGSAGHMVHSPKSANSMGVIMPIYTVGIVIFFSYTLMKLLFKKKTEGPGAPLYPPVEPSAIFRKEVFESQKRKSTQGGPLIVNAMTALLDEVDQEIEARRKAREVTSQKEDALDDQILSNGNAKHLSHEHDQPSVKILGMEMTASCEGGQKWEKSQSTVIPKPSETLAEPSVSPQEIFLEGTLPAQSQLLVSDSTVEEEANSVSSSTDPPVILASKMTLSVISMNAQENGKENGIEENPEDVVEKSKYTTASEATAADCEISDEEGNDIEEDLENVSDCDLDKNELENINNLEKSNSEGKASELNVNNEDSPEDDCLSEQAAECVMDNEEEIENIERSEDDSLHEQAPECDIDDEEEIENIDRSEDNSLDDMEIEEIIVFEDIEDDDNFEIDPEHKLGGSISPDTVENIGNIIDEIITDGALRLEHDNDYLLGNFQHSTGFLIDDCDNSNEEAEENYNNNNETTLDTSENRFEHFDDNSDVNLHATQFENNKNIESTDLLATEGINTDTETLDKP
ncbi:hypothetical protein RN001_001378 [Aquatica leii]|uniref:Resistance to inhibitors of cholinesterase protein 3 N-terminal domain-containing protein n=1 Tax=Aquatica leii TaxID=1421715 RepID=A0AAN7SJJ5_9COLE|nr:hypothetical protein RN001_001378 [Aquatica leii]